MKSVMISQSNYIPWKGYFDMIASVDVFVVYDEVQYTKNDWRNRNLIKTKNELQWLTIPVKQESLSQTICETEVFNTNWKKKHIGSLQSNYGKALFFKEFKERIFKIYELSSTSLSEINLRFIKEICAILEIDTRIIDSRSLNLSGDKQQRLVQACQKLNADTYLSGPAAKSYIDEDFFASNQIKLEWMDYSGYKTYNQLHPPFKHEVSIIDLIFNEGANAKKFLKSYFE
jgi:hypothetical protein